MTKVSFLLLVPRMPGHLLAKTYHHSIILHWICLWTISVWQWGGGRTQKYCLPCYWAFIVLEVSTLRASPARMMVPTFAILKLKYCTNHVALYMPRPRKCTANKHTGHPMTNLSLEEAHALQIYRKSGTGSSDAFLHLAINNSMSAWAQALYTHGIWWPEMCTIDMTCKVTVSNVALPTSLMKTSQ